MAGVGCIVMGGDHLRVADGARTRQLALPWHAQLVFTHHEYSALPGADITFVRGR
jgi:N-dimethylarginine dimethylaminohydrolase